MNEDEATRDEGASGESANAPAQGGSDTITVVAPAKKKATLAASAKDPTAEFPVTGGVGSEADAVDADDEDWDDEEEHVEHARAIVRRRAKHARRLSLILVIVAAIGVGFAGGVYYQKYHGSSSTSGSAFGFPGARTTGGASSATIRKAFASRTSGGGISAIFGGGGTGVDGTVTAVTATKGVLYVTEGSSGALVKVETTSSTSVTSLAKTSVSSVHPGDTVSVAGAKQATGSYMAGTIKDTGAAS